MKYKLIQYATENDNTRTITTGLFAMSNLRHPTNHNANEFARLFGGDTFWIVRVEEGSLSVDFLENPFWMKEELGISNFDLWTRLAREALVNEVKYEGNFPLSAYDTSEEEEWDSDRIELIADD